MNSDCLFCKISRREVPADIVYEDENTLAFLDISPVGPGHTLVIPKRHVANIYEMSHEDSAHVFGTVSGIAERVKHAVSADGINIHMNNDGVAGQVIFHAHVHIIPRFEGDPHQMWQGGEYKNEEESKEVGEKIREVLENN